VTAAAEVSEPVPPRPATHHVARFVFLRALAVVYAIAFASFATQAMGLVGRSGIAPAERLLAQFSELAPLDRIHWLPTVFWLGASDAAILVVAWAGVALSALLLAGVAPASAAFALWLLYLSIVTVGGDFFSFQWDSLLLETGFLAIFLTPLGLRPAPSRESPPSPLVVWLFRWLLFRLMFRSGAVKLLSGDPTWRDLSALDYHWWTQPLPTWVGWWAEQMPHGAQVAACVGVFVIELALPCLIAAPQAYRRVAFWGFVALQAAIAATGNYGFFNLLTLALCLLLLDDTVWPAALRARLGPPQGPVPFRPHPERGWPRLVLVPVAALLIVLSLVQSFDFSRAGLRWPDLVLEMRRGAAPWNLVNVYGLFAVMTTNRLEIRVEGSRDGREWRAYAFRWKPGDPARAPAFVQPHMPRLDWQMWFAALAPLSESPWFLNFAVRLLQGSPDVITLVETNPFPDAPPRWVRARLERYRFTTLAERRETGAWWSAAEAGLYLPPVSLDDFRNVAPP
jgi:lipase maturation factor 1